MKMNMKAKHILVITFAAVLTGCSFLEIDTENKIASSEVDYTKTSEMYQPVVGAYSKPGPACTGWTT